MEVPEDDWLDLMARFQRTQARAEAAEREVAKLRAENAALRAGLGVAVAIMVPLPLSEAFLAAADIEAATPIAVVKPFDGSTPLVSDRARAYSTEQCG